MKRALLLVVPIVVSLLSVAVPSAAQDWSAAQKEVWKNVEAYWSLDAKGDTAGFMEYVHADYAGWNNSRALPSSRDTMRKFMEHGHKTTKMFVYDIQPVAIKIHGNVAFVHYHFNQVGQNAEGKPETVHGRWTDILMKQGDRWVMIGDHGGPAAPQ